MGLLYDLLHRKDNLGTYVRYHPVYPTKELSLESSPVLCNSYRTYHHLADQVCSSLIRPVVARLRPANLENPIVDMVYIVNGYRGGSYGFPSCHAANSFGLALYVVFTFRKRWLSLFIIAWAVLNCYTRIYLGVHYPGDLLVGGIIGGFGGWMFSTIAYKAAVYLEPSTRTRRNEIKQTSVTIYAGLLTVLGILIYSTIKSW